MGRWLVILSLAAVAMTLPQSSDVPLWKRLLSSFSPAPLPADSDEALSFGAAAATPYSAESVTGLQAPEPLSSAEPITGSQAREALNSLESVSLESVVSIAGWRVR